MTQTNEPFGIFGRSNDVISVMKTAEISKVVASTIMTQATPHSALSPITVATAAAQCLAVTLTTTTATTKMSTLPSPKKGKRHEDGWKEVVRRYLWTAMLFKSNNRFLRTRALWCVLAVQESQSPLRCVRLLVWL